jgi:transcriptional regulator GlxA family with amidase domain
LLTGIYQNVGEASRRLLDAIGPVVVRPGTAQTSAYVGLLASESLRDAPRAVGGPRPASRSRARRHCPRPLRPSSQRAPGWYSAVEDDLVGSALRAVHADPAAPWSVTGLTANTGLSRPAFSRRFSETVGEPPMAYVRRWRLALAADHLADPDLTVGRIASLVGCHSPFTFSAAFKAHFGVSPSDYRADIGG